MTDRPTTEEARRVLWNLVHNSGIVHDAEPPGISYMTIQVDPDDWRAAEAAALPPEQGEPRPADPLDVPTLAEAIRLWYVKYGRNPVTGNYDQPQPAFIAHEYARLRDREGE